MFATLIFLLLFPSRQVHGSGRHQVTDEVSIWEDSANLWHEDSGDLPSGNRTNENGKLMGVFTFTFRCVLHLPFFF